MSIHEFSSSSGWWRPKVPPMQLQSTRTVTRALDWHFSVADLTLPSVSQNGAQNKSKIQTCEEPNFWSHRKEQGKPAAFLNLSKNGNSTWRKHGQFEPHSFSVRLCLVSFPDCPKHPSVSRAVTVPSGSGRGEGKSVVCISSLPFLSATFLLGFKSC